MFRADGFGPGVWVQVQRVCTRIVSGAAFLSGKSLLVVMCTWRFRPSPCFTVSADPLREADVENLPGTR